MNRGAWRAIIHKFPKTEHACTQVESMDQSGKNCPQQWSSQGGTGRKIPRSVDCSRESGNRIKGEIAFCDILPPNRRQNSEVFTIEVIVIIYYDNLLLTFSSVQSLSCVRLFVTPWIATRQASLSITNSRSSLRLTSIESVMTSSHLILCRPFSSCPQSLQHQSLFQWVNSSREVAKVLEFQLQHHSFQRNPRADLLQNGMVGSPCSPRDSQESSPTPQFKSINSLSLSFLYSPTHIHTWPLEKPLDLGWQSNVSAF